MSIHIRTPSEYLCYIVQVDVHVTVILSVSLVIDFSLLLAERTTVTFTYSVIWHPSDVAWASRWDSYLRMSDVQIHWFAICNSVAIVLFLSGG